VLVLSVPTLAGELGPLIRVVEVGEARVVELQIAAPERGDLVYLLGVGGTQAGPELFLIGIHAGIDRRPPAAIVNHAGGGDGQLRGG